MFRTRFFRLLFCLASIVTTLVCTTSNPYQDEENFSFTLLGPDTIPRPVLGDTVEIAVALQLARLASGIVVSDDVGWDTSLVISAERDFDTVLVPYPLVHYGARTLTCLVQLENDSRKASITFPVDGLPPTFVYRKPKVEPWPALEGQPVTMTIEVSGTPPFTCRWMYETTIVQTDTTLRYVIDSYDSADHKGKYRCIVTNTWSESGSEQTSLWVELPGDTANTMLVQP